MTLEVPELEAIPRREQLFDSLKGWGPWIGKGSLAVVDQGLFASSNFLLNILLARWLAPADYGAFAMAYSIFLLLLVLHSALLTTPMLVFAPGKYSGRLSEYLGILLRCHFVFAVAGSALLVVAAFVLGRVYSVVLERALLALAIAAPFILLLWLLRRMFYARLDPQWAAAGGGIYLVILLVCALALRALGRLTPTAGFLAMAAASIITCALLLAILRPSWVTSFSFIRSVASDHWSYGKWVAAGAGPNWIMDNIYFVILPAWMGLADAGALKALVNLAQPALQTMSALGILLTPILVRDRRAGGIGAMKTTMRLSFALFAAGSVVYLALLWGLRFQIFHSVYGGKYSGYDSWPLLLVGLLPLAQSLPNVAGAGLGAIEQPKLGFWADGASAAAGLLLGVPLLLRLRVGGALLAIVLSYTMVGIFTLWFFLRCVRRDGRMTELKTVLVSTLDRTESL